MAVPPADALVVGVGNTLMGDDGIGVEVARRLAGRRDIPVKVVEAGTGGFGLINIIGDSRCVIFIDAVDAGATPGQTFWVRDHQIVDRPRRHSLHEVGLDDVVALLALKKPTPAIRIIGVQPAVVGPQLGLSRLLASRLGFITKEAADMINETVFRQAPRKADGDR